MDEAGLFKGAILTEGAVQCAAEAGQGIAGFDGAGKMGLVEECEDSVAVFKAGDAGAGGDDGAGAVGDGYHGFGGGEGVFALKGG